MSQENFSYEPEFSFRQIIEKRRGDITLLWKNRLKIIIIGIIGILLGFIYAWQKPVTYTARLSFVVEEAKGAGGSMLSGLAGQLGFDLGGISGTGGVLAGDNVQQLLKSQRMIKNTLLTPYRPSSTVSLADKYAESYEFKESWAKKYNNGKPVNFPTTGNFNRLQDSLIHIIIKQIADSELGVAKSDKKLTFFEASVTMKNEELAQLFTTRIIDEATRFYIDTKTKRQRNNVNRLAGRADSIGRLLNQKTYTASAANNILLDVNPSYATANVGVELKERDKIVLQTIYAEIVKNLEVSRTMLIQETPTFQVVDEPEMPLKKNRLGYLKAGFYGGLMLGVAYCLFLVVFKEEK